ncbi:LLM class flavin-dependent oxidoreductase [Nonomuraea typhae]|uniref:LLM class flavin-dependent oxidoreductase n=1 Tax=Nonomuraea typhae TaxID=2603600 RepID=UPI0012F9C7F8|nr:LLM class flavin-dependent oxidoreductase [Nonomuraea typhae]
MPVEFLGMGGTNARSETDPLTGPVVDKEYTLRLARAHEDNGWDRVLFGYSSASPDGDQVAAYVAAHTERLQLLLAHRPGVTFPTHTARQLATLDRFADGRLTVHIITGGNDTEQRREGDYFPKDERYARTHEYIRILKRALTSRERFSHEGRFYRFEDFVSEVFPVESVPISFGGSSAAAYRVGAAEADVYCLWGEPLAGTAEQIATVKKAAEEAGRATPPRIQVAFRPIIAPTEKLAWEKAERTLERITRRRPVPPGGDRPQNAGSQRLLKIAEQGERFDRALWTATAKATGGAGNSNALVGTPEQVAQALLDYVDLGVSIISMRGYDILGDAIEVGREVIPLVREEVARRDRERARAAQEPPAKAAS